MDAQLVPSIFRMQNATGGALKFVTSYEFDAMIRAISYPQEIPGGQCAEFVHSAYVGNPPESMGAVIYQSSDPYGSGCYWMVSWLNKYGSPRKVYTEVKKAGSNYPDWQDVRNKLNANNNVSKSKWENYEVTVDEVQNNAGNAFAIFKAKIKAN